MCPAAFKLSCSKTSQKKITIEEDVSETCPTL
jgi:hypothetical protein